MTPGKVISNRGSNLGSAHDARHHLVGRGRGTERSSARWLGLHICRGSARFTADARWGLRPHPCDQQPGGLAVAT